MTFNDIPASSAVFVDANTFIYHFQPHPVLGPACQQLVVRIENGELEGFASAHALSEVAHRIMTFEAAQRFGRSMTGIALWLKGHPAEVQQLTRSAQAIDDLSLIGIQVLPVTGAEVSHAADLSRQFGLLSSDALIVAVMQHHGLTLLASHDADFDRVPGLTRYAPA
jgi:predicted nucleic acid-binding protein